MADGVVWRRLWSLPERLVIEFVDEVLAEVREDGSVIFDRMLRADVEEHLLLDHVLPLVLARRREIVLHGAVLSLGKRAAVLVGPSGAGKSTLTAFAEQQGWTVGGDDGVVLTLGESVTVEPTYPMIRLTPEATELLGVPPSQGVMGAGKRRIPPRASPSVSAAPQALAVVAALTPTTAGSLAAFSALNGAAAHAALFGTTFHTELTDGPLLRHVMAGLGRIVEVTPVGRLSVPRGRAGLAEAEEILRRQVAQ